MLTMRSKYSSEGRSFLLAQVGEVHRGNGHLSLEYHLNARPSAKLDLSDALRDAGHDIPLR